MSRTFQISASRCDPGLFGDVEAEVVIHFTVLPGEPERGPTYERGGAPATDAQVEFSKAEEVMGDGGSRPADRDLTEWAERWLSDHADEALVEAAEADMADREDAAERQWEARRDDLMIDRIGDRS